MGNTVTKNYLTLQEYLAIEEAAEYKSEYYNGEMFAMSGGSIPHSRTTARINTEIGSRLRGGPCYALSSDTRVHVPGTTSYVYPDFTVVRGPAQSPPESPITIINPSIIVGVLSPSTERYDRTAKFWDYEKLASLRHYLLVAQVEAYIQHHFRGEPSREGTADQWLYRAYKGLDAVLVLASMNIEIPLRDIYEGIEFPPPPEPPPESPRPSNPPTS